VLLDENGRAQSIVGALQDVTEIRASEAALRMSEERLELAARGSSDGLWDWRDISDDAFWVSPRYAELLGYTTEEFVAGASFVRELVHPDDRDGVEEKIREHLAGRARFDTELRLRTRAAGYRWFRLRGEAFPGADGRPRRMAGSLVDIHERREADARLRRYQEELRFLAEAVSKAAEEERRRIGTELHDRTIQTLGFMRVKLSELRARTPAPESAELVARLFELLDSAIGETRLLLQELGPPMLYELGFEPAVEWLAERAEKQYGFSCTIACDQIPSLGEDAAAVLFQAVRELLTNVGKHAEARKVAVSIAAGEGGIVVCVEDDGIGFAPADRNQSPTSEGNFGLFSIRERLRVLGGELGIDSSPGKGARITLRAPLNEVESVSHASA
jgi:PAS domain S-box-containing protein